MTDDTGRQQTRFDRRKVELPHAVGGFDFAAGQPPARRASNWPLGLSLVVVVGLAATLAYGYLDYHAQLKVIDDLQTQLQARQSGDAQELVRARAEIDALQADIATHSNANDPTASTVGNERDAAVAALALARQRIAALQAELGVPATGRPELGDMTVIDPGADSAQQMDALLLEVRLLTRERDAARDQIDRMLNATPLEPQPKPPIGSEDDGSAARIAELLATIADLEEKLDLSLETAEQAERQLDELRTDAEEQAAQADESAALVEELNSRLDRMATDSLSARELAERDLAVLRAEKDDLGLLVDELRAQLQEAENQTRSSSDAVARLTADLAEFRLVEAKLEEVTAANASLNLGMTQLQERAARLEAERDELRADLTELRSSALDDAEIVKGFEQERSAAENRRAELETELEALRASYDRVVAELGSQQDAAGEDGQGNAAQLAQAQARIVELGDELSAARSRLAALEAIQQASGAVTSAAGTVDAPSGALAANSELNEEIEALRSRERLLETALARFTPQPPAPAPR